MEVCYKRVKTHFKIVLGNKIITFFNNYSNNFQVVSSIERNRDCIKTMRLLAHLPAFNIRLLAYLNNLCLQHISNIHLIYLSKLFK